MGKKILLADDSITIQKVIELTFSDEDFEVVTVGNGRLAIEKAQEVRPDVVLCDIIMPERDGYEVCEFIKKSPTLSHVPVLLLTGAFEPFDQERAARVGCDGFLAKPFEPQTLIAKVKDLLAHSASRSAPAAAPARTISAAPQPLPPPTPAPVVVAPSPPPPASFSTPARAPEPEPIETYSEPEPGMTYLPEEAFADASVGFADAMDFAPETVPGTSSYEPAEEFGAFDPSPLDTAAVLDEAPAETVAPEPVEPADELLGMTDDEAETLGASPDATIMFSTTPSPAATWGTDSTMEVSLEDRAAASVEAQATSMFEVFEDDTLSAPIPEPPTLDMTLKAPPAPVAQVEPPPPAPAAPAPVITSEEPQVPASFAEVAPAPFVPDRTAESVAAAVPVPMEMVEQIAQRVVAQISEKVVRDVAWEVIPDLAEALIKQEIERLKAELQQT